MRDCSTLHIGQLHELGFEKTRNRCLGDGKVAEADLDLLTVISLNDLPVGNSVRLAILLFISRSCRIRLVLVVQYTRGWNLNIKALLDPLDFSQDVLPLGCTLLALLGVRLLVVLIFGTALLVLRRRSLILLGGLFMLGS